jgi:nucleolar protein 15
MTQEDEILLEEDYTSEDDSSDSGSDEDGPDIAGVDISKLPTVARDDAIVSRKLQALKAKKSGDKVGSYLPMLSYDNDACFIKGEERGTIYLGRIPHGFYEDEMKGYFSQFGDVTRLRLSRNKKV